MPSQHVIFISLHVTSLTVVNKRKKMSSTVDEEYLRKQVMIGQFVNVVGCTSEQALQMLQSAQWNYEVRKNMKAQFMYLCCTGSIQFILSRPSY